MRSTRPKPAPVGEVIARGAWRSPISGPPLGRAGRGFPGLNQAQSTPLSEAHLEPPRTGVLYYIEQMDFLLLLARAVPRCFFAHGDLGRTDRSGVRLSFCFFTPLTATRAGRRSLELESAQDEEELQYADFHRIFTDGRAQPADGVKRLSFRSAAGLPPWTHPGHALAKLIRDIRTRQDVGALCADATRAKADQHLRLRTSRSARPQD